MERTLIIIVCLWSLRVNAQYYKELRVGDAMPNYEFHNLSNYSSKIANLSDFSDKLVILDFWSTSCTSCIAYWPKLLELQRTYDNKIQIILVNANQSEKIVQEVIKRQETLRGVKMNLPSVCLDTVLGKTFFPHQSVPHVVWIGENGRVLSISYSESLNEQNISTYLSTGSVNMPQKEGFTNYQVMKMDNPYFFNGNGRAERLFWYSVLAHSVSLPTVDLSIFNDFRGYQISLSKTSVENLYRVAYNNLDSTVADVDMIPKAYVDLNVNDKSLYQGNNQTNPEMLFTYQLYAPPYTITSLTKMQKRMRQDLDFYFGLSVKWQKKQRRCLVLKARDTTLVSYTGGNKSVLFGGKKTSFKYFVNRVTTTELILSRLQFLSDEYPVIDETGMKGFLGGIELDNVDVDSYESLDKAFRKYGLSLTLEEREVAIFVISEPSGYKFPFAPKPLPGTSLPENVSINVDPRSFLNGGWIEVTFDRIEEAKHYRLEYRKTDDKDWKVINFSGNKFNRLIHASSEPAEYVFRLAGIAEVPKGENVNYYDTSALKYCNDIKVVFNK